MRFRIAIVAATCVCAAPGQPQSLNLDLDIGQGPAYIGNGAPSSEFGGAAAQPGAWNRLSATGGGPYLLYDLNGLATLATIETLGGGDGIGYHNTTNSGDFSALLNDGTGVGSAISGGSVTWLFAGLRPGAYDIYTYAVNVMGARVNEPVFVPEADFDQTQVVTGPMPGNSFGLHITHSIHRVTLAESSTFHVTVTHPAGVFDDYDVTGFQIMAVPEAINFWTISAACVALLYRHRSKKRKQGV